MNAPMPLSPFTLAFGRRAGCGLLGVDRLYRSESGDEDGLVVLNLDADGSLTPRHFPSYAEAETWWQGLRDEAAALAEPDRRLYYDQLCHSTLAFIRWRTEGLGFQQQLSNFLHVPVDQAPAAELDGLRSEMGALLTEMGYSGDLPSQCAAWEERNRVPADEVPGVLSELMSEAWDRTSELMDIPADKSDGMRVETVTDVAYNARCDYLNRTIQLNTDPVLTLPGLRHLAVHEGYPGHYVQFKLRETMVARGAAAADVLLSVVNTASSSVFEGIADTGMSMIGWDSDPNDRFQVLMNRYRAGIGTGAAWRLHAAKWDTDRTTAWLRGRSLVGGSGWVENRMKFIAAPARAVLIWSYWWGEQSVRPTWEAARGQPEQEANFLSFLYGRMHSIQSVRLFSP